MNGVQQPITEQYQVPAAKPRRQRNWVRIVVISGALVVTMTVAAVIMAVKVIDNLRNSDTGGTEHVVSTDDPYKGSADAQVVIVEFGDFQCPYCYQAFPVVREITEHYGDQIKFIYRDFPISGNHPDAETAAVAGECADEQGKFWEMHDKLFINQSDLSATAIKRYAKEIGLDQGRFNSCLDNRSYLEEVREDFTDGWLAGVDGTPTFFINGQEFQGSVSIENFKAVIDGLLEIYRNG